MAHSSGECHALFLGTDREVRVRTCVIGLLALVLLGCAGADVGKKTPAQAIRSAIILVPGYYGTRLVRQSDGAVIWISVAQALFGDVPLTLPIPGLGFHDAIPLQPDGILEKVPIVPLLYALDGYGSMREALQAYGQGRETIVPFSYDWRDDVMVSVRKLAAVIQDLRLAGTTDIRLVAHSLGGLVAAYYLRYGTQDPDQAVETWEGAAHLNGVALLGVPFKGTMIAFRNSQYGVIIGLNRTLLQSTAVASFPATYYLLPAMDADVLLAHSLEPMTHAIRNGNHWTGHRWGLLKPASLPEDVAVRREAYTLEWLARSKRFSALLHKPMTAHSPLSIPMLSITGRGQVTLANGIWDQRQRADAASLIFDERMLRKALPHADPAILVKDGDGTVTTASAALPPAYAEKFQVTHRQYDAGHVELMTSPAIQQDIIAFLATSRRTP
jgi:pimeloyl-ACP methyl ester carboxylesterase